MEKSNLDIIRALLGIEVKKKMKFATTKLIDGTTIETADENFVVGSVVYVVGEDGSKSLAPAGVHQTETAQIEVDTNGVILNITEKQALEEETNTGDTPIAEEVIIEIVEKVIEEKMVKVKETMELFVNELQSIKEDLGKMKNKYEAFSNQPAAQPLKSIFSDIKGDDVDRKLNFIKNYKKDFIK